MTRQLPSGSTPNGGGAWIDPKGCVWVEIFGVQGSEGYMPNHEAELAAGFFADGGEVLVDDESPLEGRENSNVDWGI